MKGGGRKFAPDAAERVIGTFGNINASTSSYETRFPVGMLADDLELYLDFISDVVFQPRFDLGRVNQERQRVLRETADAKSNPAFQDNKDFMDALYGVDSPHTYFVLGKEDVVARATPNVLKAFHERGYNPNNMDLILVGALPENVDELVAKYFADKPRGNGTKYEFPRNPNLEGKTVFHRSAQELYNGQKLESNSAHFSIGFVAPTDDAEDGYAVGRLVQILGGDANSRLFKRVSQEMGLAYGIGSNYICKNNAGAINVGGSVQATRADEAIDTTFHEMNRLKNELVDSDELARINRNAIYGLAKHFETNEGHVGAIEVKWDRGLTPELHLQKMDAVTPEMVREAANKYFPKSRAYGRYVLLLRDPLKK
ncbi:insulinase family protein [Candidatus Woesearchaeota archaeon]|nr:insulinase family protein [Candidatus Woesearchaeota archaeon]